jgi:predicted nucleic acid-binding protein
MPSDSTVFVDTNVLLYAQDPRDPAKQQGAAGWLRRCWHDAIGRISTQVLHEYYVNLRRTAPRLAVEEARALVRQYRAWKPWLVDADTVDSAWALQDQLQLSYWDALMVAAAQQQGCAFLLTEDLQHGQRIDRIRILNPFVVGPAVLDETGASPAP